nr:zinc ribbon domain-containing protein [Fluoribacter dumoffii]
MSQNESQGVICTRCQSRNEPGARFCGQCGQAIQNTVCRCGASIPAEAKFCGQCGSSL